MNFLERLGEYLIWADAAIWEIAKDLSDEEFDRSFREYGGSIRKRYNLQYGGLNRASLAGKTKVR